MNIDQLKNLLQRYGLKPNFTYGQNFLVDDIILEDIVDAAGVTKDDCILEIGPGIGNLTRKLCERGKLVLSIEKDPKFFPVLRAIKKDHKNFRYEIADALEHDFQKFFIEQGCTSYKVVANIPYYITGKILKMLMTPLRQFSASAEKKYRGSSSEALAKEDETAPGGVPLPKLTSITVLTQKEVARNVVAKAGDLSLLAISVQLYGEPCLAQIVPARSFYPSPKVDSAILNIRIFGKPKYDIGDEKKFFKILKACFTGKRKQIHNTLANNLKLPKETVSKILEQAKINPAARPQELSIEQWIDLTNNIEK